MQGEIYVGTSGWNYDGWRSGFYEGVPKKRWLEHNASRFNALEVNATFYRLQTEKTFEDWKTRTPPGFVFTAKGHKYVTHNKKLLDPDETVVRTRDNARPLEPRLTVVLWQLPQSFQCNEERLEAFLQTLKRVWRSVRHVIELRHPSWFGDEIAQLMATYDVGNCQSDAADWAMWDAVTTNLVYVRLHGHTRTYASAYSNGLLDAWAEKARAWSDDGRDVYVFFDNDAEGAAPFDALKLMKRLDLDR